MVSVDAQFLEEWLSHQRWFASKTRELGAVNLLEALPLRDEAPQLVLALVEARFHTGMHELYQVLLGSRPVAEESADAIFERDGVALFDAVADPEQGGLLASFFDAERAFEGEHGCIRFHRTEGAPELGTPAVRTMGAEQSNTSVILDDTYVLKVFRRLEAGTNPELEMLRFLTAAGFTAIARLEGWYDYEGELMDATLGVVQDFVPGARDGWDLALDAIAAGDEGFVDALGELGRVTGRMHSALGSGLDKDFVPEESTPESLSLLVATIDEQIERVFRDLPQDAEGLEAISGRSQEIRDRLQMMSHVGIGGRLIRHHGDFHLGQTLRSGDGDWVILDFEGEPARPLLERRRKRSPLRDVAGMLRSFAYAASASGLLRDAPAPAGWEERARSAFLDGYLETVEPALLPAGQAATDKLLAIFELEKAVYELRYELDNRPDWVGIPVAGIARLLEEPLPS